MWRGIIFFNLFILMTQNSQELRSWQSHLQYLKLEKCFGIIWIQNHSTHIVRLPLRTERQNRNMVSSLMCSSLAPVTLHNTACGNRYAHWTCTLSMLYRSGFPTISVWRTPTAIPDKLKYSFICTIQICSLEWIIHFMLFNTINYIKEDFPIVRIQPFIHYF